MKKHILASMVIFFLCWGKVAAEQEPEPKTFYAVTQARAVFGLSEDLSPETNEFDLAVLRAVNRMGARDRVIACLCDRADTLKQTLQIYYGRSRLNLVWSGVDGEIMHSLEIEITFDDHLKPRKVVSAITTQGRARP